MSASNCAGRVLAGVLSDGMMRRFHAPRPLAFAGALLLMGGAMLLLLLPGPFALYLASVVAGTAYGGMNSLNPTVASEIYGNANMAFIYPIFSLGIVAGSWTIATFLTTAVYDRAKAPGASDCTSASCFAPTFGICAALCGGGALLSLELARRARPHYRALRLASAAVAAEEGVPSESLNVQ